MRIASECPCTGRRVSGHAVTVWHESEIEAHPSVEQPVSSGGAAKTVGRLHCSVVERWHRNKWSSLVRARSVASIGKSDRCSRSKGLLRENKVRTARVPQGITRPALICSGAARKSVA
jgi:hypothetical protein